MFKKVLLSIIFVFNLIISSAMLPSYARILICPHCKGEKAVLSLMSGNTCRGHQWWDFKEEYPMLPHVSLVQKCPHCGKYFMTNSAKSHEGKEYSFELGHLSHAEMRQALAQFEGKLSGQERTNLLFEYVWAYNDAFQRENTEMATPCAEELKEFQGVIRELVSALGPTSDRLALAELLREARFFDEAMAIVEKEGEQENPLMQKLSEIIKEKSLKKDSTVGIIPSI